MDFLLDDTVNPRFVHQAPLTGPVETEVDRAIGSWCGFVPMATDLQIEYLQPARGDVRVDLWVESMNDRSCTYGFLVSSSDGNVPFARGERTVDAPRNARNAALLKGLPAYA
jgi:hypothetical protein